MYWVCMMLIFLHCNNVQWPSGCDLVYIHPIKNGEIAGFYYFMVVEGIGRLMHCSKPPKCTSQYVMIQMTFVLIIQQGMRPN